MLALKQKLRSKRGASMIMAMVFLLFSMLIGSSVLAAASANSTRIENRTETQQAYYSQRSAMRLMADMLTDEQGDELQITIRDITVQVGEGEPQRTVSFDSSSLPAPDPSGAVTVPFLQQILFEVVVSNYMDGGAANDYGCFPWIQSGTFADAAGAIRIHDPKDEDGLMAYYTIHNEDDFSVEIDFGDKTSHLVLKMDGSVGAGNPRTVTVGETTTTTTTTVIRWSLPEIQKSMVTPESQTGGA